MNAAKLERVVGEILHDSLTQYARTGRHLEIVRKAQAEHRRRLIRAAVAVGISQAEIAQWLGVSRQWIHQQLNEPPSAWRYDQELGIADRTDEDE